MKKYLAICLVSTILSGVPSDDSPAQNPEFLKAQELESQGNIEEALRVYEHLFQSDRNDRYFWKLITLYETTSNFKAIEDLTLSKLKENPDHLEAKQYLARSYYGQGERKEARRVLLEIIGDRWDDTRRILLVGNEFINQGEHDDALEVYNRARRKAGNSVLFSIEMARIYAFREKYVLAIEEYLKSLESVKVIYLTILQMIAQAQEAGITDEKLSRPFENYLEKYPGSIMTARLLSELKYHAGDYDDAYQVLIGPAVASDSPSDIWNMAERLFDDGHRVNALEVYGDFSRYFEEAPNRIDALMKSAAIKADLERNEDAIQDYQIIMDNYSGTIHASFAALRLLELSQDRASFEGYTKLLDDFASKTGFREVAFEAYLLLGKTFIRNGQLEEAHRAFSRAKVKSRSKEEQYTVSVQLAYLHFFTVDFEAMSNEIRSCITSLPEGDDINDLLSYKVLGMECSSSEEVTGFEMFSRGHYAFYRGAVDTAIEDYTAAANDTSSVVAPYAAGALGELFKSQGNFAEAVKWYLYAADVSADTTISVGALIEAAHIVASELDNTEQAKSLYLQAIASYPGNVYEGELRNKLRRIVEE